MKNDIIYCPANIEFLLHCHTTPGPFSCHDVPMFSELASKWVEEGVIERDEASEVTAFDRVYRTTTLGKAWVKALCNTPKPKAVFVDEAGRVLQ